MPRATFADRRLCSARFELFAAMMGPSDPGSLEAMAIAIVCGQAMASRTLVSEERGIKEGIKGGLQRQRQSPEDGLHNARQTAKEASKVRSEEPRLFPLQLTGSKHKPDAGI